MRFMTSAIVALLAYSLSTGCSSMRKVPFSEARPSEHFAAVTLHSGDVVEFDEEGGFVNHFKGTVDGTDRHGKAVSIPLSSVAAVRVSRTNMTKTVVWAVVITGVVVGLWAILVHNAQSTGFITI